MVPNNRLDSTEAAVLFKVLDDTIGVFRFPEMTEDDWKYWAITRERFLSIYTSNIPRAFWFQGGAVESCTLNKTESGFEVVSPEKDVSVLEECNAKLSALVFESFVLPVT